MVSQITKGIKVSVETQYQPSYSSPQQYHHVFVYKVIIKNESDYTVQLMNRHWIICDVAFSQRVVDGEGVVGMQPVIEPGELYEYVSGCNLKSGIGKMTGSYSMKRTLDGTIMEIEIPEFIMVIPDRYN